MRLLVPVPSPAHPHVRDGELAAKTAFTPTGRAAHDSRHNAKIVLPRKSTTTCPRRQNPKKAEELSVQELEVYPPKENGFSNRRFYSTFVSPLTASSTPFQFLEENGFKPVERGQFSNGRATIRVEGSKLRAVPGDGTKDWIGDIGNTEPDALRAMLSIVLKAPSFASQATIDQAEHRRRTGEAALATIADAIRMHPDTHSGIQLRQFVWSIFNGLHVVCLWRLKDVLDSKHPAAVGEVLRSWMDVNFQKTPFVLR